MCKSWNGKLTEKYSYTGCLVTTPLLFPATQARKPQLYNNFSINKPLSSATTHKYFTGYMNTTPCVITLNIEQYLPAYCTAALLLYVPKKHWIRSQILVVVGQLENDGSLRNRTNTSCISLTSNKL